MNTFKALNNNIGSEFDNIGQTTENYNDGITDELSEVVNDAMEDNLEINLEERIDETNVISSETVEQYSDTQLEPVDVQPKEEEPQLKAIDNSFSKTEEQLMNLIGQSSNEMEGQASTVEDKVEIEVEEPNTELSGNNEIVHTLDTEELRPITENSVPNEIPDTRVVIHLKKREVTQNMEYVMELIINNIKKKLNNNNLVSSYLCELDINENISLDVFRQELEKVGLELVVGLNRELTVAVSDLRKFCVKTDVVDNYNCAYYKRQSYFKELYSNLISLAEKNLSQNKKILINLVENEEVINFSTNESVDVLGYIYTRDELDFIIKGLEEDNFEVEIHNNVMHIK